MSSCRDAVNRAVSRLLLSAKNASKCLYGRKDYLERLRPSRKEKIGYIEYPIVWQRVKFRGSAL